MQEDTPSRRSPVERVEIRGTQDSDLRRNAIAGKIVIGREEIERFGDTTVGEVLRRLPSVTLGGRPGRGGEIRLRGMGSGFTQILVDGERMPAGLALETLTPDQIERIELFRAPTAEHGARAIAGTINIVLREPLQRRLNDLRLTAGLENGRGQPHVSWTRNDRFGEKGTYNLSLSASRNTRLDDIATRTREVDAVTGATLRDEEETGTALDRRERIVLSSRLHWRHGPGEAFTLTPFIVASEGRNESRRQTVQTVGAVPLPYASAFTLADSNYSMFRLNAQEQRRIGNDARIELRGMVSTASWRSRSVRQEFDAAQAPTRTLEEKTDNTDLTWRMAAKLTMQHSGGAQPRRGHRDGDDPQGAGTLDAAERLAVARRPGRCVRCAYPPQRRLRAGRMGSHQDLVRARGIARRADRHRERTAPAARSPIPASSGRRCCTRCGSSIRAVATRSARA
jgi:iron complex outermembrane receptor protein